MMVQYKVNDMVKARITVNNSIEKGVVEKLALEARGPFRVVEDHGNGSYSLQLFDRPNGTLWKFQTQDMYALPPQILPCDDIDLVDFCYLNTYFMPVKHPFKENFSIKSYNSMWLDNKEVVSKPDLLQICGKDIIQKGPTPLTILVLKPAKNHTVVPVSPICTPRSDTVEETETNMHDNAVDLSVATSTHTVVVFVPPQPAVMSRAHSDLLESKDLLFCISYCGADTLRPCRYLVQVRLEDGVKPSVDQYYVDFPRNHPDNNRKRTTWHVIGQTGTKQYRQAKRNHAGTMVALFQFAQI